MKAQEKLGLVKGLRWTLAALDRRTVHKTVVAGNAVPYRITMAGKFSARPCEHGILLDVITTGKDGTQYAWPVSQSQADSLFLNHKLEFEMPVV